MEGASRVKILQRTEKKRMGNDVVIKTTFTLNNGGEPIPLNTLGPGLELGRGYVASADKLEELKKRAAAHFGIRAEDIPIVTI